MIKLLVFIILALITLPLAYWLLTPKGGMRQFLLIAGGAILALVGIVLQLFYSVYLVLLLIVCLAFLASYGVTKYMDNNVEADDPVPVMPLRGAVPVKETESELIPEIQSANQQPETNGMSAIEPARKEQSHE